MQSASVHALDTRPGRIEVVDVLRGFALFGIIVTHSAIGFLAGRPPRPGFMNFTFLDGLVNQAAFLLFNGKFFTVFSFLFGLSFAIQLHSSARKGAGFSGRYAWRLVVLALIAMVHGAFFSGDILIIYAFLGLLLIPLQKLNTKFLVVTALLLVFNVPGLIMGLSRLGDPPPPAQSAARVVSEQPQVSEPQRQFDIKQSGSVVELARLNVSIDALMGKVGFQVATGRLWMTFGLFLLGLCAGRAALLVDTEANRAFFRKLLVGGGFVALPTTIVAFVQFGTPASGAIGVLTSFSQSVQQASLSAFYVAAIALLYWRDPIRGLLPRLAPMGRMGLTTYLMQSVFGLAVFYGIGFGMLGHLGTAAAVGAGIAFFGVQAAVAQWWMSRFSLGPVEWLWRSLTHLKLQPNGRPASAPAAA
jgi:uncharacterized protein